MRVLIDGRPAKLSDRAVLGQGGEARVFQHGAYAVKIYHSLDEAAREAKRRKICAFPGPLPRAVSCPRAVVTDPDGRFIGFAMDRVEGAEELRRLAQPGQTPPFPELLALFRRLRALLSELHAARVIVGDLNDGNVLVRGIEPILIDADSFQVPGHRCTVAHERFLDPRLYGLDLAACDAFTAESDWYAFAVLLFASLLAVHPFGGVHPAHPTIPRRAQARVSIFDPAVTRPKAARDPATLPERLSDYFRAVFDGGRREPFPPALLDFGWTRCACGLEHARPVCPSCAKQGHHRARALVLRRGRCRAIPIFETRGRILTAVMQGGLRYAYQVDDALFREGGRRVGDAPAPGAQVAIGARSTFVAQEGRIVELRDDRPPVCLGPSDARPSPFAANSRGLFCLDQEWIVEARRGVRFGQILEGHTRLFAGETLGYGLYRAGLITVHFLFSTERPGLIRLPLPPIAGRLLDLDVVFDAAHVLIAAAWEVAGATAAGIWLVDARGSLIAEVQIFDSLTH